jgi:hypothetical protein
VRGIAVTVGLIRSVKAVETRGILIFVCSPSNLAEKIIAGYVAAPFPELEGIMKVTIAAAILLAGAMQTAQASASNQGRTCIARVLHSEELPFAPMHYWLVRATLEITPPNGAVYEIALQDNMPWQAHPPRRGQTFRLQCDPDNPSDLHLTH